MRRIEKTTASWIASTPARAGSSSFSFGHGIGRCFSKCATGAPPLELFAVV
jgi:hypothetical protein